MVHRTNHVNHYDKLRLLEKLLQLPLLNDERVFKVRTQYFSEKFRKKKFFDVLFRLKRYFQGVVWKFLLEVPKFKENTLICIITVLKVRDLLLTRLQVITILA